MKTYKNILLVGLSLLILACSKNKGSTDNETNEVDKSQNKLAGGESGHDILANTNFDKIRIEIGFVVGFKPTEEAINELVTFIKNRTFKEDIEVIYNELEKPAEDELSLNEIVKLEDKNRTVYNTGRTLAIYIYFADAPAKGDDMDEGLVTLGAIYRNTSMVIHESTIKDLASKSFRISSADIESATLNHEFGHLFGLVNLGTDMVNDHESKSENSDSELEGDKHCNVDGCLMRAELQFGGVSGKSKKNTHKHAYENGTTSACVLSGNTILRLLNSKTAKGNATVNLDPECILDLQANGGK